MSDMLGERLRDLLAQRAAVVRAINEKTNGGQYCARCFATNVFWMSVPTLVGGRIQYRSKLFANQHRTSEHVCKLRSGAFPKAPVFVPGSEAFPVEPS